MKYLVTFCLGAAIVILAYVYIVPPAHEQLTPLQQTIQKQAEHSREVNESRCQMLEDLHEPPC